MIEHPGNRWHPIAIAVFAAFIILLFGGVLLHWSWNTLAEPFGLATIQFKHAIAGELMIAVLVGIGTLSGGLVVGRRVTR